MDRQISSSIKVLPVSLAQSILTGLGPVYNRQTKAEKPGFSLVEAIVALALTAVIAGLAINVLVGQGSKTGKSYARTTKDFISHLATVYRLQSLKTGLPIRNTNNTDGMLGFLPGYDSTVVYTAASPANLQYPEGAVLYLKPEQLPGISDPVYTGSNNRDWLVYDVNGSAGPNSYTATGDRVMLYVNNETGQILTAWQVECDSAQSFYDVNYVIPNGGTCDVGVYSATTTTTTSTTSSSSSTSGCPDPGNCTAQTWDPCLCTCVCMGCMSC